MTLGDMMQNDLIGKEIEVDRTVPGSLKSLYYRGILLEITKDGIWLDDRKSGKIFLPFSQIAIREVKN